MAGSIEEKWTVDKLGDSNWSTWKFQMRHLLLAKNLWGHVDDTDVLAGDATAVRAEFKQKAERAFSTSVMAVSTHQLYLVTSCTEPKDVWDKLCEHYECETLANRDEGDYRPAGSYWITYFRGRPGCDIVGELTAKLLSLGDYFGVPHR